MDNQEFLNFFNNLSDVSGNSNIIASSEGIANIVLSKQKFDKSTNNQDPSLSNPKYKLYKNIISNPTEDLMYAFRRLIGGIVSTGLNMRRGFVLCFSMLIEKLRNNLDIGALLDTIQAETIISKSEQSHIKNCILTGKILIYRSILTLKNLDSDNILRIFKIILDLLSNKTYQSAELPLIVLVNDFMEKIFNSYYNEFTDNNQKKAVKNFEKILNLVQKGQMMNRNNFTYIKDLSEISIYFIFHKLINKVHLGTQSTQLNEQFKKMLENFVSRNFLNNILEKTSFINIFTLIMKSKKDNDFHVCLSFLLDSLKNSNDFPIVISFWNNLVDANSQQVFKSISQKNYQFLIFKFAKFILENYTLTNFSSVSEIFDLSFFESIMTFSADKKFKYINQLIEILTDRITLIKKQSGDDKKVIKLISEYCFSLLNIFGVNAGSSLSPNTNKNFFMFLFNNLQIEVRKDYIDNLVKSDDYEDEESDDEEEKKTVSPDLDTNQFNFMALKQILLVKDSILTEEQNNQIMSSFFCNYYRNNNSMYNELLEDRLIFVVLSKIKTLLQDKNTNRNMKIISHLVKMNKFLQDILKKNKNFSLEADEVEEYNRTYKKFYKMYKTLIEKKEKSKDEAFLEKNEKICSSLKIGFLLLLLTLKNSSEFSETLEDLLEIGNSGKDDEDWGRIFTDIVLSQLSRGKNLISEFVMNCFKKTSKYLNADALDVIVEFIEEDFSTKNKNVVPIEKNEEMSD